MGYHSCLPDSNDLPTQKATSGNALLADYLEWAWHNIRNGKFDAVSNLGKTAEETMESGLELIIPELRKQGRSK